MNLDACPNCGGPADNGFDRSWPEPVPYFCTSCNKEPAAQEQTKDSSNTSPDESPAAVGHSSSGLDPVGYFDGRGRFFYADDPWVSKYGPFERPLVDGNQAADTVAELQAENAELRKREEWITNLFERKWNGVVGTGSGYTYHLRGDWRHIVGTLSGDTLTTAIDAARKGKG